MITITVSKEEVRSRKQYESDRYKVEMVQDCDDPNKAEELVSKTFALIRSQIERQKEMDGKKA